MVLILNQLCRLISIQQYSREMNQLNLKKKPLWFNYGFYTVLKCKKMKIEALKELYLSYGLEENEN